MSDAPPNDWIPVQYADARNWGPWIFHGEKAKRPAHILIDTTRETAPDTVIYLTKNGHGWGVNFSPSWDEITWYRLRRDHSYYRSGFSADRIKALEAELHIMQTASIAEVAARNISVAEYMAHWEVRAEKAEAENKRLRDAVQEAFAHMDCSEAYLILKHALAQKGGE